MELMRSALGSYAAISRPVTPFGLHREGPAAGHHHGEADVLFRSELGPAHLSGDVDFPQRGLGLVRIRCGLRPNQSRQPKSRRPRSPRPTNGSAMTPFLPGTRRDGPVEPTGHRRDQDVVECGWKGSSSCPFM